MEMDIMLALCYYFSLCGRMPFSGDNASQLEEQVLNGELKFKEPEWISISEGGKIVKLITSTPCCHI